MSKTAAERLADETAAQAEAAHEAARALGRRGGLKGGPARAASMTPKQRKRSAKKAWLASAKARAARAAEAGTERDDA